MNKKISSIQFDSWQDVVEELVSESGISTEIELVSFDKSNVPHPSDDERAEPVVTQPLGQQQTWKIAVKDTRLLIIREYDDRYEVTLEWLEPTLRVLDELRTEEPVAFVAGTALLGAAVGNAAGRSKEAMLVGGLLGGLFGVLVSESSKAKKIRR